MMSYITIIMIWIGQQEDLYKEGENETLFLLWLWLVRESMTIEYLRLK